MQGAEYQVTGFRRGQCQADGFQVPKFAHQNDVRVFPQRRAKRFREAVSVPVHFALVDQALFAFVDKFDRVLNGQDVFVFVVVDVVHHRCQRGGLARTGRAGHQHQPPGHRTDIAEHTAHTELFHGQHFGRNGPEHRAGTAVLIEGVHPETGHAGHLKGEVGFQEFFKVLALLVIHYFVDQTMHLLVLHRRQVDPPYIAVHPDHGGQACGEVQV